MATVTSTHNIVTTQAKEIHPLHWGRERGRREREGGKEDDK